VPELFFLKVHHDVARNPGLAIILRTSHGRIIVCCLRSRQKKFLVTSQVLLCRKNEPLITGHAFGRYLSLITLLIHIDEHPPLKVLACI
jgi:hypothetical protein